MPAIAGLEFLALCGNALTRTAKTLSTPSTGFPAAKIRDMTTDTIWGEISSRNRPRGAVARRAAIVLSGWNSGRAVISIAPEPERREATTAPVLAARWPESNRRKANVPRWPDR
jgi:hypothetical protein